LTESRHPYDIKAVEKRNIFALQAVTRMTQRFQPPDNPYALIGVVGEGETLKAIFVNIPVRSSKYRRDKG